MLQRRQKLLPAVTFTLSDYQTSNICISTLSLVLLAVVLGAVIFLDVPHLREHLEALAIHNLTSYFTQVVQRNQVAP